MKLQIWIPTLVAAFLFSGCYTQLEYSQRMHRVTEKKPVRGYSWSDEEERSEEASSIYIEDNANTTAKPYDIEGYEQQAVYEDEFQPVYKDYETANWYYDNGLTYDGGYYSSYVYNHLPPSYWYPYYYDPFYDYPYYGSFGINISFHFGSHPWWYYRTRHYYHDHFYHHFHHSYAFWHPFHHHHHSFFHSPYHSGINFIVLSGGTGTFNGRDNRTFRRRSIGTNRTRVDANRRSLNDRATERRRSIGDGNRAKIRDNRQRSTGRSRGASDITRRKDDNRKKVRSTGRSGAVNRSNYRGDTRRRDNRDRSYTPRKRNTNRSSRNVKKSDGPDLRRSAVGLRSIQRSRYLQRQNRGYVPSRIGRSGTRSSNYRIDRSRSGVFNRMLKSRSLFNNSRSRGVRTVSPQRKTIKAPTRTRKVRTRSSSRSSSSKKRSGSSKRKKRGDG